MRRLHPFLVGILLCLQHVSSAQWALEFDGTVQVERAGNNLDLAWAGGLNFAQFSQVDLNLDGLKDLVAFDRAGNKLVTLLNMGGTGTGRYKVTRAYDDVWPFSQLHDWALFRDYDCDGKEDIFTYSLAGFSVFRNTSTATELAFEMLTFRAECDYVFVDGSSQRSNLFVSSDDLPGLVDVDGDGDLDVLTFSQLGTYVEYYKNLSVENYGTCDSLALVRRNACWGRFAENSSTNAVTLNTDCQFNVPAPEIGGGPEQGQHGENADRAAAHAGSTLTPLDLNGDGVMDLLLGDIAYSNLVALTNGGTVDNSNMVAVDNYYPINDVSVNLPVFPAGFHLDVDGDNDRDLLVCPSARGLGHNYKGVWYYRNLGSDAAPDFQFQQDDLFQGRMLDFGEGANPVPFDHNGDGLMDLIISNEGYYHPSGDYIGKLALLENIGTTSQPAFRLVTDDYMNLSTSGIGVSMYPTFGDVDGDGDLDMYIGDLQGRIHFYRNTATGPIAQFTLAEATVAYQDGAQIDVGRQATPQFIDLDRDGRIDLVVGEQNGNLNYIRNVGSTTAPTWILANDSLGRVRTVTLYTLGHSAPFIFQNQEGNYELLAGSESGTLWHYTNIDGNLDGTWTLADTSFLDIYEGYRSTVCLHDYTGDGELDMVVGNFRGGVSFWRTDAPAGIGGNRTERSPVTVRPNPTNGLVEVWLPDGAIARDARLSVMDPAGRMLSEHRIASTTATVDLSVFGPGLYLLSVETNGERLMPARVVVH